MTMTYSRKKYVLALVFIIVAVPFLGGCASSSTRTEAISTELGKKYLSYALEELKTYPNLVFTLNFQGSKLGAATQLIDGLEISSVSNAEALSVVNTHRGFFPEKFDSYTTSYRGKELFTLLYVDNGEVFFHIYKHNVGIFLKNNSLPHSTYLRYLIPFLNDGWYEISAAKLIENIKSAFTYLALPTQNMPANSGMTPNEPSNPIDALVQVFFQVALSNNSDTYENYSRSNGLLSIYSSIDLGNLAETASHFLSNYSLTAPFRNYINDLATNFPPADVNSIISLQTNAIQGRTKKSSPPVVFLRSLQDNLTSGLLKLEFNITVSHRKTSISLPLHPKKINVAGSQTLRLGLFTLLQRYF